MVTDRFNFGLSLRSEYGSANRNYPLWSHEHLRAVSHVNDSPGEHRSRRLIVRRSQMGRFYCCRTRGPSSISISASRTRRQHLGKIAHVLWRRTLALAAYNDLEHG